MRPVCANATKFSKVPNLNRPAFPEIERPNEWPETQRGQLMAVFQDIASMDRILYAIFVHENKSQETRAPFAPTHKF